MRVQPPNCPVAMTCGKLVVPAFLGLQVHPLHTALPAGLGALLNALDRWQASSRSRWHALLSVLHAAALC